MFIVLGERAGGSASLDPPYVSSCDLKLMLHGSP